MSPSPVIRLMFALVSSTVAATSVQAQPKEPGDQWEVSTEMSMGGMTMPGATNRVCSPRRDDSLPIDDNDGKCQVYDVRRAGNTTSWKMKCAGNPPSSGTGDITYQGRDRYAGKMTMLVDGQTMVMKMSGRRTGECDAGATKRQVAALQAQAQAHNDQATAQVCGDAVRQMIPSLLSAQTGIKCDARYKTEFCQRYQTVDGYTLLAKHSQGASGNASALEQAAAICGRAVADTRTQLCSRAIDSDTLEFLATAQCPEATRIAQRECAGRGFTSPPAPKYRAFCSAYGRQALMQPAAGDGTQPRGTPEPPPEPKPESQGVDGAINKGKDLLRGLFR